MDEAIGNLNSNNQGVFMEVMHPTCISFGKDNVVWLSHVAYWELGGSCVDHGLRWFLDFLCIFVLHAPTTPDLMRSPEYHLDLYSFRHMIGVSP